MSKLPEPPKGFRFDAFADVRMGKSLFQMEPEDWLVPAQGIEAGTDETPQAAQPEGREPGPSQTDAPK